MFSGKVSGTGCGKNSDLVQPFNLNNRTIDFIVFQTMFGFE